MTFPGFGESARQFLHELVRNNKKEWFEENRSLYEMEIKNKSLSLIDTMADRFASAGLPLISDKKTSMFRINRDVRFSSNKDPYKTNVGIIFPYSPDPFVKGRQALPGLYFHFDAEESFIAGGLYMPDPIQLKQIREYIAENWESLESIINSPEMKNNFSSILKDESLKRVPKGFDPNHPGGDVLKLKGFTLYHKINLEEALSPELPDILIVKAIQMLPFLDFFYKSLKS